MRQSVDPLNPSHIVGFWLLVCLLSALLGCSSMAQKQPPVVSASSGQVVLYNATVETVSVWMLEAEPRCLICPDDPLFPGASRTLELAPGPVTWEVVAVPFGDVVTAYRLPNITAVIASIGVTDIILSGHAPEP